MEPFDLEDTHTITDVRSAGGFLQADNEVTMQIFMEVTALPVGRSEPEVKFRFVVDLDGYFAMAAGLEHAAKTALALTAT